MRLRRRPFSRPLLWLVCLALVVIGARWAIRQLYPLHYRESLWNYSRRSELSPYLVAALIRTESGWRPEAVSRKGAQGLMQIMPTTGAWVMAELDIVKPPPAGLHDPALNIEVGTFYLAHLRSIFKGELVPALAAYNGGEHNVREWLTEGWAGTPETLAQIPFPETRRYVARVLADYHRYRWIYGDDSEEVSLAGPHGR